MRKAAAFFILPLFFLSLSCQKGSPMRWMVYYGPALGEKELKKVELAILDPDAVTPSSFKNSKTSFIGYISVGEAEAGRYYWPMVSEAKFLVEKNPVWGSWLVDVRSSEWRSLLLETVIPNIFAKGYKGLFLDTVDTAAYLEEKDPQKFRGSREAMTAFVKELRRRWPDKKIFPNNGLELLESYGALIDGVVVEDLYTRYNFEKKLSEPTPPAETEEKEKILDAFRIKFKKPVLNILYDASDKTPLIKEAIQRSKKKGYEWYRTTVDLKTLGTKSH